MATIYELSGKAGDVFYAHPIFWTGPGTVRVPKGFEKKGYKLEIISVGLTSFKVVMLEGSREIFGNNEFCERNFQIGYTGLTKERSEIPEFF